MVFEKEKYKQGKQSAENLQEWSKLELSQTHLDLGISSNPTFYYIPVLRAESETWAIEIFENQRLYKIFITTVPVQHDLSERQRQRERSCGERSFKF